MNFEKIKQSELKDKYFARTEKWNWFNGEMIHVMDSKKPRMITFDPWPQQIYLDAEGRMTVEQYILNFATKYPENQVPFELPDTILEQLNKLIYEEQIIEISDKPILLANYIRYQMTEEGIIELEGNWSGSYTYNIPEEYKTAKTREVNFNIIIQNVNHIRFSGIVEDDLKTGGTPGIGNITGRFTKQKIKFIKKMPISASFDIHGNHVIDESKPHPTLIYNGFFSLDKQYITGTWKFKRKKIFWKGIFPIWYSLGNGHFIMKKEQKPD